MAWTRSVSHPFAGMTRIRFDGSGDHPNLSALGGAPRRTASAIRLRAVWLAEVEGRLGDQTAQATVDYVPAHGEDQVTLAFDADPRAAEVSVAGWSKP